MSSQASNEFTPSPKQIVFLFMAATVVAVVVFLCGVLVGRGVPFEQAIIGRGLVRSVSENRFVSDERPAVTSTQSQEPSAAAVAGDDLSYHRRLDGTLPADALEPLDAGDLDARLGGVPPMPVPDDVDADVVLGAVKVRSTPPSSLRPTGLEALSTGVGFAPASLGKSTAVMDARTSDVQRDGFTVQVTALRERVTAELVAEQLVEKGYPAFVSDPLDDAPVPVFRVRVGRYADRAEAERILERLEREEHFTPWITH